MAAPRRCRRDPVVYANDDDRAITGGFKPAGGSKSKQKGAFNTVRNPQSTPPLRSTVRYSAVLNGTAPPLFVLQAGVSGGDFWRATRPTRRPHLRILARLVRRAPLTRRVRRMPPPSAIETDAAGQTPHHAPVALTVERCMRKGPNSGGVHVLSASGGLLAVFGADGNFFPPPAPVCAPRWDLSTADPSVYCAVLQRYILPAARSLCRRLPSILLLLPRKVLWSAA